MATKTQWAKLHAAYSDTGLTKAEFHRTIMRELLPSEEPMPTLRQMNYWFAHIENTPSAESDQPEAAQAQAEPPTDIAADLPQQAAVRTVNLGENLRLAELDSETVAQFMDSLKPEPVPVERPRLRQFKLISPGGTVVEFETAEPEKLALQMFATAEAGR